MSKGAVSGALEYWDIEASDANLQIVMARFDLDRSGRIEFDEFLARVRHDDMTEWSVSS
jgi:hypothetical protein